MNTTPENLPTFLRSPLLFWGVVLVVLFLFLAKVASVLLPFVLGMLLAYLFDPVADRLQRMKCSRSAAAAIITITLFAALIVAMLWLLPMLARQLAGLVKMLPQALVVLEQIARDTMIRYAGMVPMLDETVQDGGIHKAVEAISSQLVGASGDMAQRLVASGGAIVNTLSLLFITPIVSFYSLRDWDRMTQTVDGLLPRAYAETVRTQCRDIDRTLAGFLRGQLNVMAILAVYYCVALTILGLPFSIVIGLLAALFIIIPYVGTMLTMAIGLGAAYMAEGVGTMLYATLAIFLVGQIMEQQVLTPKIVGEQIGLHPLWMIFAMLAGAALFGIAGVLLAVPVAAVLGVLVRFALSHYKEGPYFNGGVQ